MQVTNSPGAIDAAAAGHSGADNVPVPENDPSFTVTSVSTVLPVFVIRKL